MSIPASLAPELAEVLRHGSRERRAETVTRIALLFVEGASRFNEEHVGLFDEVLCQLNREANAAARVELSHRLAPIPNAPRQLVLQLAGDDDIAVAQPVLKQSARLLPAELIKLVGETSQGHLLAISKRTDLKTAVTDALIEHGNPEVLRSLAVNLSAEISEAGFASLIAKAGRDGALATQLALRADLSANLLRLLVRASSAPARERMMALAHPERRAEIASILAEPAVEKRVAPAARNYAPAEQTIVELLGANKLNEAAVVEFAVNREYEELVVALASLCAVPISVVDRVIAGERLDPVLILCKSAGWGWQTARAIMSAMTEAGELSSRDLDSAYLNFERLSSTTAQRVMRFWQVQHWHQPPQGD